MDCYPKFINRPFQFSYIQDNDSLWFDIYLLIDKGLRVAHYKFKTSLLKEEEILKINNYYESLVNE